MTKGGMGERKGRVKHGRTTRRGDNTTKREGNQLLEGD